MKHPKLRSVPLGSVVDKYIGKRGRERFETELKLDLLGEMIRKVRNDRNRTQEQLGKLVGVQKAQSSKLENNSSNVTIVTLLNVFSALKANVSFSVELSKKRVHLA